MSEVKRYFSEECRSTDGLFVLEEDYARLEQECDKLAGLLADVKADYTHAIHWEDLHSIMKRIDAALIAKP